MRRILAIMTQQTLIQQTTSSANPAARKPRRRWAKGQSRPTYLEPGDIDQLMIMFIALMSEVAALRDRLDSHEAVADTGATATTATVEAYRPTVERDAARAAGREAMLRRVLRAVTEERDAAMAGESA